MHEADTVDGAKRPHDEDIPPAKRRRLSATNETDGPTVQLAQQTGIPFDLEQAEKETRVGINAFVNANASGFSGILKQRYTDFLVNEILPNGEVLHLQNLAPPKRLRPQEEKPAETESISAQAVKDGDVNNEQAEEDITEPSVNGADGAADQALAVGEPSISDTDRATLENIFGTNTFTSIISLFKAILKNPERKRKDFRTITSDKLASKEIRTNAHQAIRRIFSSKLETTTGSDDTITISAAGPAQKARGVLGAGNGPRPKTKMSWDELGGEYLHFTLYKENKDTMEAVYFLASQLKVGIKGFQFGGTKDRRGVTVQRCSAYRVYAEQMAALGRQLRGSKVGDFAYCRHGLELGDLGGNEFVITLRDCHFPGEQGLNSDQRLELATRTVEETTEKFAMGGFLNYYGLQRFGSFSTSTDAVGTKLLQGNFKGAVDDLLSFNPSVLAAAFANSPERLPPNAQMPSPPPDLAPPPQVSPGGATALISSDDRARALALHVWTTKHDTSAALALLPRKFSAESNIIRHLGQRSRKSGGFDSRNDYQGALQTIPRNLRLMYVHAYQSLVWNSVAGLRWAKHGSQVVEGDLVLIHPEAPSNGMASGTDAAGDGYKQTVDENGETIILPAPVANTASSGSTSRGKSDDYQRARPLSAEEAASGRYSIFDVVLPLPGFDVVYPPNAVGDEYKAFMASDLGGGLDPKEMRRSWKDLSLSGGYRKILGRAEGVKAEVRTYTGEEQLVETDVERMEKKNVDPRDNVTGSAADVSGKQGQPSASPVVNDGGEEKRIAVVLRMRLAPSMYATMALRELMKEGGVRTYKPDYGAGAR